MLGLSTSPFHFSLTANASDLILLGAKNHDVISSYLVPMSFVTSSLQTVQLSTVTQIWTKLWILFRVWSGFDKVWNVKGQAKPQPLSSPCKLIGLQGWFFTLYLYQGSLVLVHIKIWGIQLHKGLKMTIKVATAKGVEEDYSGGELITSLLRGEQLWLDQCAQVFSLPFFFVSLPQKHHYHTWEIQHNFQWNDPMHKKRYHLMDWQSICCPIKQGV